MSSPGSQTPEPPRRVQRLDSLANPIPRPPPRIAKQKPEKCVNPDCLEPHSLTMEDGKLVCESCGTVADDSPDLVTDLQFGLEGGRAVLHGRHVDGHSAVATGGDSFHKNGGLSSLDRSYRAGEERIDQILSALGMASNLGSSGKNLFRLAAASNFIQGRRIKNVAAVTLYISCRAQRDMNSAFMLIDFADVLDIDVFHLGRVYIDLVDLLKMNNNSYRVPPINPEDLTLRFADRLEFGTNMFKVANDAVRIVQRMERDWLLPGRRPAGVCAAALILAARMNNFRRTPRELMYVAKVNEATIVKRLEEFSKLQSATLTIEDFRNTWYTAEHDPPSFGQVKDGKTKRGKKRKVIEFDDDGDDGQPESSGDPNLTLERPEEADENGGVATGEGNVVSTLPPSGQTSTRDMPPPPLPSQSSASSAKSSRSKRATNQQRSMTTRRTRSSGKRQTNEDAPLNLDPDLDASASQPTHMPSPPSTQSSEQAVTRKRGRPKKPRSDPAAAIEDPEIATAMSNPFSTDVSHLAATVEIATNAEAQTPASAVVPPTSAPRNIGTGEVIDEDEFADDPEVQNCLLNEKEVEMKTRIWTSENADWLRAKASKQYKLELEIANGTQRPKKARIRRRRRIGDLSTYANDLGEGWESRLESGEGLADSAAEAVGMMLKNRMYAGSKSKMLSSKINYEKMRELYTPSSSGSRRTSVAPPSPSNAPEDAPVDPAITSANVHDETASQDQAPNVQDRAEAGEGEADAVDEEEGESEDDDSDGVEHQLGHEGYGDPFEESQEYD